MTLRITIDRNETNSIGGYKQHKDMISILSPVVGTTRGPAPIVRQTLLRAIAPLISALFFTVGSAQGISAQTNTAQSPTNRWLLIVQTSSSMKGRAEAVQQIAGSLLWSGMNGQMRSNDNVGLWTFNKELYTGFFPMQVWTPGSRQNIASGVFEFLKEQKYGRSGHFDVFFPDMERIIKNSEFITVVVISDGYEDIHYTPFDDKINTVYKKWQKRQEKAHIPFVTVLRAQHGQLTDYAVAMPPWSLDLPPLPPELSKPAEIKIVQNAPPQPPPQPPVGLPLIVSGKKSEPTPSLNPSELSAPSNSPSTPPASNGVIITHGLVPWLSPAAPAEPPKPSPAVVTESAPVLTAQASSGGTGKTETASPAPEPMAAAAPLRETNMPSSASAAPDQTDEVVPQGKFWSRRNTVIVALGIAGLILASIGVAVVLRLVRSARTPLRLNLTAPSLDRDKKL
jgi:hypothetical protein